MHRIEKNILHNANKNKERRELKNKRLKKAEDQGMSVYLACACAEGLCEGGNATEEQIIQAWQYLHDTGVGYKLPGWYGRTLTNLIHEKIIKE